MTYFRFFEMTGVLSVMQNYVRPDNHDVKVSYRPMNTTGSAAMKVKDPHTVWILDDEVSLDLHFILQRLHRQRSDDTTVIGLIQDGDESAFRQEAALLTTWSAALDTSTTCHSFGFI